MQSVEPPEAKITVPVATPGSPATESVSCAPYTIVAGAAASVNEGVALVIVSVVVVVCAKNVGSPE